MWVNRKDFKAVPYFTKPKKKERKGLGWLRPVPCKMTELCVMCKVFSFTIQRWWSFTVAYDYNMYMTKYDSKEVGSNMVDHPHLQSRRVR